MNIDTTITLDTALNTGLALLGWLYIMFSAGRWLSSVFLKKWDKHRKQEWRQKAMNEFFGAFNIDNLESGEPARVITRGDIVILVYRSEGKNERD
ncbi:DUF4752 family protein [Escherichia coli]|uniref:DUF4752 family protein n=1 Tax=Escherichia coli TaxID=562 RepID=UPI000944B2A0|nr:DUF4752 family protein [Escherichia coli]EFD0040216.1 DUF4752 family protein [Escherichia coli]EFI5570607.1 DUF4752 family protein [Escherichia coli]EFK1930684.1 DUF4752 family protein [Escherichia coli]EFK3243355.1 DUF4752 family protein [Escherichia coli]EII2950385.1 DUF4752 family protein [Escherichia coli]